MSNTTEEFNVVYTLLADGSSDRILQHPINWVLEQHDVSAYTPQVAHLERRDPPPEGLEERVRTAVEDFPCAIVFVHRDAEKEPAEKRLQEIEAAFANTSRNHVAIVPVRMTEAWFLFNQAAIRLAAGNPNGKVPLDLPAISRHDNLADPKTKLREALLVASQKRGRHLARFRRDLQDALYRVAELIEDYSPLRRLPAFREFEERTARALQLL